MGDLYRLMENIVCGQYAILRVYLPAKGEVAVQLQHGGIFGYCLGAVYLYLVVVLRNCAVKCYEA